jgi:dTDP-4-dehydrorhamnose 3,5-epimerase
MEIIELRLKGLKLIKPKVFKDNRGFFMETFQESTYKKFGITERFQQDNHSYSMKDCIRGMHFQSHPGQAKLVRAPVGRIFDVAVDIRPDSPTYGQWEGVILDDKDHHQLFIPTGFAHGFCVLSDHSHVMYKVTTPYHPDYEKGFCFNDPDVNIQWPTNNPILSERDRLSPLLSELKLISVAS